MAPFVTGDDLKAHPKDSTRALRPFGSIIQPVHKSIERYSEVVGYLVGILAFDDYLVDLLPEGVCGIDVVVSNSCGSVYTYMYVLKTNSPASWLDSR